MTVTYIMNILDSIAFDKEQMLVEYINSAITHLGITEEEFYRDYILEEFPVVFTTNFDDSDLMSEQTTIKYEQKFTIRPKTDEEKQLELETHKEKNVDPDHR